MNLSTLKNLANSIKRWIDILSFDSGEYLLELQHRQQQQIQELQTQLNKFQEIEYSDN